MALVAMNDEIDIRHILPAIRVAALLLHSVRDATIPIGASRYMAERIPGARLVELPGEDHLPWLSDADAILGEIEEFLTGVRHTVEPDRISLQCSSRTSSKKSGRAWRPPLARSSRWPQRSGSPRTRSISWSRDQDSRRWVFRRLRRSRSGCPLRLRGVTGDAVAGNSRSALAFTLESAKSWATIWVGSRSISALASRRGRGLGRCWYQARSRTWSPVPA